MIQKRRSRFYIKKQIFIIVFLFTTLMGSAVPTQFDDTPADPSEWGFRPFDGSISQRNPPGFSWRPQKGAHNYQIQISRDISFTDRVHEAGAIQFTVYCPSVTLPSGEYFWRVAFHNGQELSSWSKARRFTIADDATDFPLPDYEKLISRVPDSHPRLFVRPGQIPRLQELARGDMKEQFDGLVNECERIMKNPPATAEPQLYPEGTVRGSDEWRAIWWGNRNYTIRLLNSAATLAFTHLLGGDEAYGQKARELLLAAAAWDPKGATGYRYNDEAGMPYNYYFSRTYTFVNDLLTDAEKEQCRRVMKVRGDEMYDHLHPNHLWKPYGSHRNRAWHFLGEIGIAFLNEIEDAGDWIWFATNVFFNVYPVWSDSDGGWHEGSAYWSSYLSRFTWWIDIQRAALGIDAFKMPFFSNAGEFALYLMPPNVPRGGFGDLAGRRSASSNRNLLTIFANQSRNGYWMDYVNRIGGPSTSDGYIGFIRGAQPEVHPKPISELPSSKVFRGTGLAMLHSDLTDSRKDVHILFKSSPFGTQSHGYEAQNAFLLYAYGEPLLIRTGQRDSYGSDHHKYWMWSTRSVNSIRIGGHDQRIHSPLAKGEIVAFQTSDAFDYVAGEAAGAYPEGVAEKFTRHILFAKPDVIIIVDELKTPEPQTIEWWLHSPEKMNITNQNSIGVEVGDVRCHINMLHPKGLKVDQTDAFDPPPRERIKLKQWHLTAQTEEKTTSMHFVTVLHPYRKGEKPPTGASCEITESSCTVRAGTREGEIIATWQLGEEKTGGGEVSAVRLDKNGNTISQMNYVK